MDEQFVFFIILLFMLASQNKPPIDPLEQKALYNILTSINQTIPSTTTDFPDDFCLSAPHAVVCESHREPNQTKSHIAELNFGFFADQTPFLPCSPNATLDPLLFTSFPYLRKLVFHKCFNNTLNPIHLLSLPSFPSSLQELVFIDNPSIFSPLQPFINNLTSLKKLVLVGNGFYGDLPPQIDRFHNLEELNLSRNNLSGEVPASIGMLKKLSILDLSHNNFEGCVPEQVGNLVNLLKLNLSQNGFNCKIPDSFIHLKKLEFLDLSFNRFGNFGVPLFLGEFHKMKEVHLSGNSLSGQIPEIWEKLGSVEKIGFSKMDLVGEIPASMGVHLKNLTNLELDNNNLEGPVPEEFGFLLKSANEINLENNNLSGRISFTCGGGVGQKMLKLAGNMGLYLEINASCCCENGLDQPNHCKTATVNGASLRFFDPIMLVLIFIIVFVFSYLFLFLKRRHLYLFRRL
ncbi:probable LRR receptor-like serine/threonine-protein kinase At4g36180 [Vicia villosa]|uniref:probable LRR receptor-like serine/threonine-protein kinase At4g36180 n=1 Tax=Vicia villosa TaxID=3911 RepID=UPI00273B25A0|nr:probable LRR receptor-like serine/threonine-protein kinase At4g36180 [Vicia villosa]